MFKNDSKNVDYFEVEQLKFEELVKGSASLVYVNSRWMFPLKLSYKIR